MRARQKKKMRAKMARYSPLRKGNIERLWYRRQSMWRDGERVYTWENSPPWVRDKILESQRYRHTADCDWWDAIYDDAERAGINITGFDDYYAEGKLLGTAMESIEKILEDYGEDCATYKTAARHRELLMADEVTQRCLDENDGYFEEHEDLAADYLKEILRDYRKWLETDYEYLTSDECLIEWLESEDDEFDQEGEML